VKWVVGVVGAIVLSLLGLMMIVPAAVTTASGNACASSSTGDGIAVMSFNVRGAGVKPDPHMASHRDDYDWEKTRASRVAAWVQGAAPDVIAFQENHSWKGGRQLDLVAPQLSAYAWVDGIKAQQPIAYRSGLMTVSAAGSIHLSTAAKGVRDRWATWAKFTVGTGAVFVVNVHAQQGAETSDAEARSKSWDVLLAELAKLNPGNATPMTIAGDFNARSDETRAVYEAHLAKFAAAGFVPAARTALRDMTTPTALSSWNGFGKEIKGKWNYLAVNTTTSGGYIDYVWALASTRALSWQVVAGPDPLVQRKVNGKQRWFYPQPLPSDHNPVMARIAFGTSTPTTPATPKAGLSVGDWNGDQVAIASQIVKAGNQLGLDEWTIAVAIMTAMGESSLTNIDHGDAARNDTIGVFQTGPEWGPYDERMDPYKAALLFYKRLTAVPGYHSLEPTIAAHRAQRNADPQHYARWWSDAVAVLGAVKGDASLTGLTETCTPNYAGDIAGPVGSCPPSGSAAEGGLQPTALRGLRCVKEAYPSITRMGGRGSRPIGTSDHPAGLAVDFMINDWDTPAGNAYGWQVAHWVQAHAKELRVKYIIYDRKKWNPAVNDSWRPYQHPLGSSPTLMHEDHVHVSFLTS